MADIYLSSVRTGLGASRLVVVKEVLPELAGEPEFADMLVTEAKLASKLSHANVVTIEDLGRDEGVLYIAMEYVEGFDLRELLRRCARQKVGLPIEFSLLVVSEILRGLDYAHRARSEDGRPLGLVHRDVSPSNVLVSFDGEVKLCDFGIAHANDVASHLPEDTIQGKAGYMSPEHARGDALDVRADVFAAGIILWELLAGRRLYKAAEGERLLDVARRAAIPPLPRRGLFDESALHDIVRRALERDRADRYPSAAPMLRDLEGYAAAAHLVASPLRFGEWLLSHFGREMVDARRGRERALRALELGPAATLSPIEGRHAGPVSIASPAAERHATPADAERDASAPYDDDSDDAAELLLRGVTIPGPVTVRNKSSVPPDDEAPSRALAPPPSLAGMSSDVAPAVRRGGPSLAFILAVAIAVLGIAAYLCTH